MDRKLLCVLVPALLLVLLASCSQVFEAGISGKVVTASGTGTTGVADVSVFAYTDKGLRDSDFTKFVNWTRTRPSEGAGYVATTNTNANGEFTVNKIVWETKRSEFGKTADVNKLYLIFYHPDYDPEKEDATVISGSTNADNVYVELEGNKSYTAISVTIYDVATGNIMTDSCTLEYTVGDSAGSDTAVVTGNANLRISFPKNSTPDVKFDLSSPGTFWEMTKADGSAVQDADKYVHDVEEGTLAVNLYMKNLEMTLPAFSGNIDGTLDDGSLPGDFDDDNLPIRLAYFTNDADIADPGDDLVFFDEVDDAQLKTYFQTRTAGDTVLYEHGLFSGVGNSGNYTITINPETYPDMGIVVPDPDNNDEKIITDWEHLTGKTITIKLRFFFDDDQYADICYSQRTNPALGHLETTVPAP